MGDEAYNLEVSSPGLERTLRVPWHFKKAMGKKIQVQLTESLGDIDGSVSDSEKSRKKLLGVLQAVEDGKIRVLLTPEAPEPMYKKKAKKKVEQIEKMETDDFNTKALDIPLDKVRKAKLVFDFDQVQRSKR